MSYRSRWFEYLCYRPLVETYYRSDPGARWEAAPKPRLTDASYHDGLPEMMPASVQGWYGWASMVADRTQ